MSESMPNLDANPLYSPCRCTCHLNPEQQYPGKHIAEGISPVEVSGMDEDVIQRSPRSNVDIQYHAQIPTQTVPSTELSTTKLEMKPKTRKQITGSWLRQKIRTVHYHAFQRFRYPLTNDRMRYEIKIEVLGSDGCVLVDAFALFDTGCPINLMSRTFASHLGIEFSAPRGEAILYTLGTDEFRSLGQTNYRWKCQTSRKFYESVWEVSDKKENFEVLIGRDTMIHNKLVKLSPDLR